MNGESHRKYRKYWIIAVLALFVGVLAVAMADDALTTAISLNTTTIINGSINGITNDSRGAFQDRQINHNDLVGYWDMSKIDQNKTIFDKSQFMNHGTWNGNTTPNWTYGEGSALSFDGVNDYVDAGNNVSLNITNSTGITISAWIYMSSAYSFKTVDGIVTKYSTSQGYDFIINDGHLRGAVRGTSSIISSANLGEHLNDSQWHHVVMSANRTNLLLWNNGILIENKAGTWNTTISSSNLLIGRRESSTYGNLTIDEVRIYNRALSEDEIQTIYWSSPLAVKSISYLNLLETLEPSTPSSNKIRLYAFNGNGNFSVIKYKDDTGMVRELVRDSVFIVKNVGGSTIPQYRFVYASGNESGVPTVGMALANNSSTMPAIGVTVESIANNSYGRVMMVGLIENVNSNSYNEGDILYVSDTTPGLAMPSGTLPTPPNITQEMGTVLVRSATIGKVQIISRGVLQDINDALKVNKSGDTMTGDLNMNGSDITNVNYVNFTGWLHSDNVQSLLQIKEGSFGSTRADGVNYTYFGLNLIHNGTGWQLLNTSDTGVIFLFGGAAPAGSNSFVVYQTQTAGSYDFTPLFGSNYLTPGEVAFGGYQPTAGIQLDVQGLGTIRAANMTGAGNAYVCVNATGVLYRGSPGC